ncbi:MAG: serine hydrolase, partial [Verrucomicrobiae bacterium]|nr:serine hydrolase [Verrucomicrobiae bacterium]
KDPAIAAITLRGLATHTSGLPRLPGNLNPKIPNDPYAGYARKDLEDWLAMARLEGPSPHLSSYSNLGMGLLGDLLARVYGQTWEDLVKEKITRPLGMTDTVVTLSPEQAKRFVPPHAGKAPSTPWTFQALAGAGALRSTAADLVTFARALASPERTPLASALLLQRKPLAESGSGGRIGLALMLDKIDGEE